MIINKRIIWSLYVKTRMIVMTGSMGTLIIQHLSSSNIYSYICMTKCVICQLFVLAKCDAHETIQQVLHIKHVISSELKVHFACSVNVYDKIKRKSKCFNNIVHMYYCCISFFSVWLFGLSLLCTSCQECQALFIGGMSILDNTEYTNSWVSSAIITL